MQVGFNIQSIIGFPINFLLFEDKIEVHYLISKKIIIDTCDCSFETVLQGLTCNLCLYIDPDRDIHPDSYQQTLKINSEISKLIYFPHY